MDDTPDALPCANDTFFWRWRAHQVFDRLWRGKRRLMSRSEAYTVGRHLLGWPQSRELHIAHLNSDECRQLIAEVKVYHATAHGKRIRAKRGPHRQVSITNRQGASYMQTFDEHEPWPCLPPLPDTSFSPALHHDMNARARSLEYLALAEAANALLAFWDTLPPPRNPDDLRAFVTGTALIAALRAALAMQGEP